VTTHFAYVVTSPPGLRIAVRGGSEFVELEYGSLGEQPQGRSSLLLIVAEFGNALPLDCSEHQFESDVSAPLRFCFQAAQEALRNRPSPEQIVLVGIARPIQTGTVAEVGLAALACFTQSLAIEAASSGIVIHGVAMNPDQEMPAPLLQGKYLPSGAWMDLRPKAAALPTSSPATVKKDQPQTRVTVVTGAAQGLGKAISLGFARRGDAVLLVDSDEARLSAAMAEISSSACNIRSLIADASSRGDMARASEAALSHWGRLDTWVNNAGIAVRGTIESLTSREWDRVMDTNLKGTLWGSQVVFHAMQESGGVILNISSTAARSAGLVYPGCYNAYSPYAASKAGIEALTRILAVCAGSGVRVNAISPGPIVTELTRAIYTSEQRTELEQHIPVHRLGEPSDVAAAAIFLASREASFISGAVLTVDGGLSACSVGWRWQ
jgi:NAD(P)-dependent dehydrogenase (short-subunit alcohol dehydrogenase family)